MATALQDVRKQALDASGNRLRLAAAFVALHAPQHLFKKVMKINGVPFLVCVDRLGVCRTFDPTTSQLIDKSQPGRPDVLAVPGR